MCKAKYKKLENGYIVTIFPLQQHLAFFKRLVFRIYFIRFGYYMHLIKFTWK